MLLQEIGCSILQNLTSTRKFQLCPPLYIFQKTKITPERLSEYKLVGVAPDGIPSIGDGLDSLKIAVNDNGVFTTFSLSDKIAQPFSEAVILNNILMTLQHRNNPENYSTVGNYPVKTASNSVIPEGT